MKRSINFLLILSLVVSFSVIATTQTAYADTNQSGPYLAAVHSLETHIQSLREQSLGERKRMDTVEAERLAAVNDLKKSLSYWENYKEEVKDDGGADRNISFCKRWIEILEANKSHGINADEGIGKEIYDEMTEEYPEFLHWSGGWPVFYEKLYYVYYNREIYVTLETLIEGAEILKETGISNADYDELVEEINQRPRYEKRTWGAADFSDYKLMVYRLLRDIGLEYQKLPGVEVEPDDTEMQPDNPEVNLDNTEVKPAPQEQIPRGITFVRGLVQVKRAGSNEWIRARRNMPLNPGDMVRTLKNSYAELGCRSGEFTQAVGSEIKLMPLSTITVPDTTLTVERKSRVRVMFNDAIKNVYSLFGKEEFEIETPSAVAGIRGTDFIIDVDEEGNTTFLLQEGSITVNNKYDDSNIILEPGQKVLSSVNATLADPEEQTGEDRQAFVTGYEKIEIVLYIGNPNMYVDGTAKKIDSAGDTKPQIVDSRTVIPIRAIVEELGGTVGWDGNESKVTIEMDGNKLELWINKKYAHINGEQKEMDVPPMIINSRTMLPVRFVTENLGCAVDWYQPEKKITIEY